MLCVAMLLFVFVLEFSVRALRGCATLGFRYRKGGEVFAAFILSPCIQLDNPSTSDTFRSYITFACENILSSIVFLCHHNAVIPDSNAPLLWSVFSVFTFTITTGQHEKLHGQSSPIVKCERTSNGSVHRAIC